MSQPIQPDYIQRGDHPTGVVFYLLHEVQIPRGDALVAVRKIAEYHANTFVVRYGIRKGEEQGTYWVGLNSIQEGGRTFEMFLVSEVKKLQAGGVKLVIKRVFGLPGDNPHPMLAPVLPHLVQDVPVAAQAGSAVASAPPPRLERPAPAASGGPGQRGFGLTDPARQARERLRQDGVNIQVPGAFAERLRGRVHLPARRRRGNASQPGGEG